MTENNEVLTFDVDELTLGQLEELEELTGRSLSEMERDFRARKFRAKDLTAIAYVIKHADDPDFTIDDARALKIKVFEDMEVKGADSDPPVEAGTPSTG